MIVEVRDDVKLNTISVISNSIVRIATDDAVFNIQQTPDGLRIFLSDGKNLLLKAHGPSSIALKVEK